ncbi:hypothetical protein KY289_008280 [Solanum tuberosum]|nr:hypothetical protein KY289_008280 [Solanum tuberosum]
MEGRNMMSTIKCWWYAEAPSKLKTVLRAIPALILWSLWKRRNHIKHGGQIKQEELIKQVTKNIQILTMGRNTNLNFSGKTTAEIVNIGSYKPKIYYHIVQWKPPMMDQLKCNTDGASKGNHG